jgi:ubiquinone/menaquinone biosynthesis C-methylase UbiE
VIQRLGRRFARFATDVVVRRPALWPLFRRLIRLQFDYIAPTWDVNRNPHHLAAFERALERVDPPSRALDLGTGTGDGAFALARRFPDAEVVGADLAEAMLAEARRKTPPELERRVRFETADAERLPYGDESFQLVTLANMIPFFDELARITAPGGFVLFSFSVGPETPIYVPSERLRAELERRGFSEFADFAAAGATAFLARKSARI